MPTTRRMLGRSVVQTEPLIDETLEEEAVTPIYAHDVLEIERNPMNTNPANRPIPALGLHESAAGDATVLEPTQDLRVNVRGFGHTMGWQNRATEGSFMPVYISSPRISRSNYHVERHKGEVKLNGTVVCTFFYEDDVDIVFDENDNNTVEVAATRR